MTADRALRLLAEHKPHLRQRFNVRDMALFGSVARGESRPDSVIKAKIPELEAALNSYRSSLDANV